MALSLSLPSLSANHLSSPVKSCSENALGDHRAFPLLKTLLNHARRRSLAPPFPPHFPVLAPFPAAAGRRVLHVGGLGAERGGWSAGCLPVRFAPTAIALAIQPRLTPLPLCLSIQAVNSNLDLAFPPSLPSSSSCGLATQPVHILPRCSTWVKGRREVTLPLPCFLPT